MTGRASHFDRVPPPALVVGAVASVQFGSAVAKSIFDEIGAGGSVLLRTVFAAAVLTLIWRPRVRGLTGRQLLLVLLLVLVLPMPALVELVRGFVLREAGGVSMAHQHRVRTDNENTHLLGSAGIGSVQK